MKKFVLVSSFLISLITILAQSQAQKIEVPMIGEISPELPILLIGLILGFFDGAFNPCALSVLFFLVAYLMAIGSKKKCLIIGITYSLIVFLIYSAFMYGLIKIISIIGYLEIIKVVIGIIIMIVGIIQIKDFFLYGKWVSLGIPKPARKQIEKLVKMATIPSAILLGLFVSLVEIPCAGIFPLVYLTILAERVSGIATLFYIFWYNFFFVLPLILLTLIFYVGFLHIEKAEKTRLKTRKYMRLIAGLIMIYLGLAMLLGLI